VRGKCECEEGYEGRECALKVCAGGGVCSSHGVCDPSTGACSCDGGWQGAGCASRSCSYDCSGHGHCIDGTCYCAPGFEGASCEYTACPGRCSAHGACLPSSVCACFDGWEGDDCATPRGALIEAVPAGKSAALLEETARQLPRRRLFKLGGGAASLQA